MSATGSSWQALLERALPILDHALGRQSPPGEPAWTLGGGTAIMLWLQHRLSRDIDIFAPSANLKQFLPYHNPAARMLGARQQFPGHYLKYELPDGEIDFLRVPLETRPGFEWRTIGGREVALETPEEVIAKKLRYQVQA